ncbi:MAG: hypothetical protein ACYCS8_12225 [Acidithiobacillus sp.]
MSTETKTETEPKMGDCAFLMRIRDRMVVIVDNGDAGTCTICECPASGADTGEKGTKRTVPRIVAWLEITAILGSRAANVALPGVVSA